MRITVNENRLNDIYVAVRKKLSEIFGQDTKVVTINRNDESAPRRFIKSTEIERIFRLDSGDMQRLVRVIKRKQKKIDDDILSLDDLTMLIIKAKVYVGTK